MTTSYFSPICLFSSYILEESKQCLYCPSTVTHTHHSSSSKQPRPVATNLKPQTPTIQHLLALSRCRPALHSTECQLFPRLIGRMFLTFKGPMSSFFLNDTQAFWRYLQKQERFVKWSRVLANTTVHKMDKKGLVKKWCLFFYNVMLRRDMTRGPKMGYAVSEVHRGVTREGIWKSPLIKLFK